CHRRARRAAGANGRRIGELGARSHKWVGAPPACGGVPPPACGGACLDTDTPSGPAFCVRSRPRVSMGGYPRQRPRRLRSTPAIRRLVAKTSWEARHLVLPMFVADGIDEPRPIAAMPGVVQHTRDSLRSAAIHAVTAGVGGLMLFGVPRQEDKDATGSAGTDPHRLRNIPPRDPATEPGPA